MANFTLFEVHLHGENGGGFEFKPSFTPSFSKSGNAAATEGAEEQSSKSRRLGRFRRSKNEEDASKETEIEVEDGDESGRAKPTGGKGALLALLFLVGAVMVVKKLKGGDGESGADLD